MKVMDNKLFSISPKRGKLTAGTSCAITLTYHHLMPGTDRVPVLLKLSRGREIMVRDFIGDCNELWSLLFEMLLFSRFSTWKYFIQLVVGVCRL